MGIEVNKATFENLLQCDLEWLSKQTQTIEAVHIDICLRWLRDHGYELLNTEGDRGCGEASRSPWRPASEPPTRDEWVIASADGAARCVAWNNSTRRWEDWDGHGRINLDCIDWWMPIPPEPDKERT